MLMLSCICKTIFYTLPNGSIAFEKWLDSIKDGPTQEIIVKRVERVGMGKTGNVKYIGDGIFEIKIGTGPGYRVYIGMVDNETIIVYYGGDKSSQNSDIQRVKKYKAEYELNHGGS